MRELALYFICILRLDCFCKFIFLLKIGWSGRRDSNSQPAYSTPYGVPKFEKLYCNYIALFN